MSVSVILPPAGSVIALLQRPSILESWCSIRHRRGQPDNCAALRGGRGADRGHRLSAVAGDAVRVAVGPRDGAAAQKDSPKGWHSATYLATRPVPPLMSVAAGQETGQPGRGGQAGGVPP